MNQKNEGRKVGEILATIISGFITVFILGTILGLWFKLFWLGYVFK